MAAAAAAAARGGGNGARGVGTGRHHPFRTKENKGLRQVQWRKSVGGTPLRDPSLTRLGSGDMQVSLAQALTRMRSDVASPSSSYSADSPTA